MRRLTFVLLFVFLLLLAACADEEQPPSPTATTAVTAQEVVPEEEPTTEAIEPTAPPETETVAEEESAPAETAVTPGETPIYLAIIWHQHQPVYFKDPETGVYVRPWVRVHATKDYVDMATTVAQYPDVHVTFNLTPSLIRQLDDLAAGAKDLYWIHAERPAAELNESEKQFIVDRFFDTNRTIIGRFPRYQELLQKRDSSSDPLGEFTTQDYLDLQILFNLAWLDPDWLAEEPLASLVAKERNYSEEDKVLLFTEHQRLIAEVIPIHRELQDAGQIEVTMTPFAHPILPLLVNTNAARQALPEIELPPQFAFGLDAQNHVQLGVELYEAHFGRPPRGMWPAEGSVSQDIISMVAQNDIRWMASDEGVLANSLGFESFTRDSNDLVQEADALYRPYYVEGRRGGPVAIVFRDVVISDKVGFTYSGMPGETAALDFTGRIHAIREALAASGAEGPHLVSVILDGENAWEHYDNDGKEFLHTLYQRLSEDLLIKTVTPTEFLELAPEQSQIEELWAGSWINHDFATWIGEDEENLGWEYLLEVRQFLQKYENGTREPPSPEALAAATTLMYIAEGSDWFWWFGADQNSGNDDSFDLQFRNTLKEVYTTLGEEPPAFLDVPVIPEAAATAERPSSGLLSPTIDGTASEEEWQAAGLYLAEGGAMATADAPLESLAYGFDSNHLYLNVTTATSAGELLDEGHVEIYMSTPGGGELANFSSGGTLLGFRANHLLRIGPDGATMLAPAEQLWQVEEGTLDMVAAGDTHIEVAIPLALIGNADLGDRVSMRLIYAQQTGDTAAAVDLARVPGTGPAVVSVPDLGNLTLVLDVTDPSDDDHGPGGYSYPTDEVFSGGSYDILNFQVGYDEETVIFRFTMDGPVENSWDSPNGLAIQTFDVYLDTDGDGSGGAAMLPGRNLSFQEGYTWDYAIHAEGWTPGIYVPGEDTPEQIATASEFSILADASQQRVTIRVPKSILGDTPEAWRYAAVVLSQEGFPSGGVWRVRDVLPAAEQWRIGGGPEGVTNHTRVLDLVWPAEGEQEAWLSDYTPTGTAQTDLQTADFAQVPMLEAGE